MSVDQEAKIHEDKLAKLDLMIGPSSVPMVIAQVLKVTGDTEESVEHLANAVESDNALTSRLLRVANSAFYGMSEEIYTVRDAIVLIGFDAVQSLAVSTEVVSGVWCDDELFNPKALWGHSLACGLFAEAFAQHLSSIKPEVAFTLGVLHDVGRPIILQHEPEKYRDVIKLMHEERVYLHKAESRLLGYHHGEVGAKLVENWKLPRAYSEAIRYHHEPQLATENKELTYLLALADATSHYANPVTECFEARQPLYKGLWEPLGFTDETIRAVVKRKDEVMSRSEAFFNTAVRL